VADTLSSFQLRWTFISHQDLVRVCSVRVCPCSAKASVVNEGSESNCTVKDANRMLTYKLLFA
jgi:hypothetical protein